MKKYLTILLLFIFALLTSCNLDNQGIFAEVIDRVPSDNRKLSFIGEKDNIIYFKSVNGIESYNLNTGKYTTIDSSEDSKKNNVFVFNTTSNEILYFVDKATSDGVSYSGCYKVDISDLANPSTIKLNLSDSENIFATSYNNYLVNKKGSIYSYSIDNETKNITFNKIDSNNEEYYVKNIDNIFVFSTKANDASTSNLKYYKFNGAKFKSISLPDGISNLGNLRSVTSDGTNQYLIFSGVNGSSETSVFRLEEQTLSKISKLSSSNVGKDFKSFIDNNCLYFAYDGSTNFNILTLGENPSLTTIAISKLGNVAIVGYFNVSDKEYKICTANNGFLTLSLDGTPHLK